MACSALAVNPRLTDPRGRCHAAYLPRCHRHGDRQQVPARTRCHPYPRRLRLVPGLQAAAAAQLATLADAAAFTRRGAADPCPPGPQRLPARASPGRLSRAGLRHPRHLRAGQDTAARQRTAAGGGSRLCQPAGLFQASSRPCPLYRRGRPACLETVTAAGVAPAGADRPWRARLPAFGRAHPGRCQRGAQCRWPDAGVLRRPGAAGRPGHVCARAHRGGRHPAGGVHLWRSPAPRRLDRAVHRGCHQPDLAAPGHHPGAFVRRRARPVVDVLPLQAEEGRADPRYPGLSQ